MRFNLKSSLFSLLLALPVMVALPFILGGGCPGTSELEPLIPRGISGTSTDGQGTGNASPIFAFSEPSVDVSAQVGQIIRITWTDGDEDDNAAITLLADPDNIYGNGNERVILALVMEDDPANAFDLDTSSLPAATYRLIARVNDGVNPELVAVAPGRILLLGEGLYQGNKSPTITMTAPDGNLSVVQNDTLDLAYCGSDPDGGLNNVIADIVIVLDTDQDPTNDLDLTGAAREVNFLAACSAGGFPRPINGVLVLGCAKDDGCTLVPGAAFTETAFPVTVDVDQIPPRDDGQPYWPRVTMWDHTNAPVHSYSRGNVSITRFGSGGIDLGLVGRKVAGAKFYGFDANGLAGSTATTLGDLDGDGADDIVVVSRYGRGYETAGNVGTAHVIMGRSNQKFGSEISLNSITTLYRGSMLVMPGTTGTFGITSVCRLSDVDGDGRPDVAFGLPYVEQLDDNLQDDLHHCGCPPDPPAVPPPAPACYGDLMPNPFSGADGCTDSDALGAADAHRVFDFPPNPNREMFPPWVSAPCSNDLDPNVQTPINGGYVILASSRNELSGSNATNTVDYLGVVRDLADMGQSRGGAAPYGARFRGGWYDAPDLTQTIRPYGIIPDNLFGQTVSSMPVMVNSNINTPQGFGPELLASSPLAYRGRGAVFYNVRQNWTTFNGGGSQSFPYYVAAGACPPGQIRRIQTFPAYEAIVGKAVGDHLGYAASAGDYNLDGNGDILMGAPGAERNGVAQRGIVYVLFGRPDFPTLTDLDLQTYNPPRMEIWGINTNDQFGFMQTLVGDVNHDGVPDIGFSAELFDGPSGTDSGAIYVIFGGRRLTTGENIFTVNQVGTTQLPGFKIYGTQPGAHAGEVINNAGDFNGDGTDDMLVCAPNEIRAVDGQNRRGVGYVIFGGPHLIGKTFYLSQVGTNDLPGVVLISPFAAGSADEAPIDWISSAGDMNGDGFADILVGVSTADFVNPLEPSQRRLDAGQIYLIYGSNTGTNQIGS